jgi:hypothetical protein
VLQAAGWVNVWPTRETQNVRTDPQQRRLSLHKTSYSNRVREEVGIVWRAGRAFASSGGFEGHPAWTFDREDPDLGQNRRPEIPLAIPGADDSRRS